MIVDLGSITHEPRHFHFDLQPDWWLETGTGEQILGLKGPLCADITLYRAGQRFVLEGMLAGGLQIQCDRCLKSFNRDLKRTFRLYLAVPAPIGKQDDVELTDQDLMMDFIRDDQLELDDIIREQIYLSLPMKCLCSENCAGLCPVCGCDLNQETCLCSKKTGHPAFSKLKHLKIKGV